MSLLGFLDLCSLILYIFIIFLLISRRKSSFSYVIKRILLILIILYIFHFFSNTLEWFYMTDALDPYEDYVQILEPIFWFFFFAIYIQEMAEKNQRISEKRYRHLFETSPYFIGLIDTKGVLIDCNDVSNEILPIHTKGDIIGENFTEIFSLNEKNKDLIPIFEKFIKNMFEGAETNQEPFDFQLYRSIGGYLWLYIEGTLVEIEKQKFIQFIIQDITERKQAERELQLERDNFLNILNSMEDGVYIIDQNYDIKYATPSLIKEFGQFEGMKCFKYFEDRNEICPHCKNKEAFQGKTTRREWFSTKNQKTYDVIDTPLNNPDGSISKLAIFRDVSENKKAEQELKESEGKYREAYNRAEFYKDIFAHDINNILQSILSGIQICQLIIDNPEELNNLKINAQIIKEQVIRGAKLVSNVRKLSQLEEAGRSLEKIEILNVLKKVISIVKKSYKDKNLDIRIDSVADRFFTKTNHFLEDVFENFLINSIKHNKNPIVEIIVKILKEQQNGINYVKMEFLDNGVGVADSMKVRIFKRAYSKEEIFLGMGLGLSLVRRIIDTYNGKIWVEDRVKGDRSKGSNFVLLIPEVD